MTAFINKLKTFTKCSPLIEYTVKVNNLLMGDFARFARFFNKKIALNQRIYVDCNISCKTCKENVRLL